MHAGEEFSYDDFGAWSTGGNELLTQPTTEHGQQLRRGDLVVPLIGAANRDPRRYPQPDALDIARRDGSSLSFGSGPHVCIGAALTLMEAEIVFRQLLRRWPELSLVDVTPHWTSNPLYRGLVTLPLRRGAPA